MELRDYQIKAVESVFEEWKEHRSTLLVLPTGSGKSNVFCEIIKRRLPGRSLVLAHRGELIFQALNRLKDVFGIQAELEMAGYNATNGSGLLETVPVVISTIQTQIAGENGLGRMTRFRPDDFDTLIIDECHRSTAESYVRTLDYYKQNPNLKILGVTATPDRADEIALGKVFETVAMDYEIVDAINDGWLVPIQQQMVFVKNLDFSQMRTTAGDLNGADLAKVMEAEEMLHKIASPTIEIIGNRKTVVFAASVKHAEMLAEIFNRHRPNMADWICGKTPREERAQKLFDYENGMTQIMVNVGVLTEGWDSPLTECVVMGKPTKSRCLYCQCVGRSTRPAPGIVDEWETSDSRRQAIAESVKPFALIIDFVGNSGRHKLMSSADILGGNYEDNVIERAEKKAKEKGGPVDMSKELEEAKDEIEAEKLREARELQEKIRKAGIKARAIFVTKAINPFDVFDITPQRSRGWDEGRQISEKQKNLLLKQGINPDDLNFHQSKQVINEIFRRWNGKLATLKQCKTLKRFGYETKEMTMKDASAKLDALAKNGWRRPEEVAA